MLFESCLKWQTERLAREQEPPCDDDWSRGGFVFRVAKSMKSSPHCAVKSLVDGRIHTQLARNSKLSFVYDFVDGASKFDSLNYVRDAARKPLQDGLSSEEFVQLYYRPSACRLFALQAPRG